MAVRVGVIESSKSEIRLHMQIVGIRDGNTFPMLNPTRLFNRREFFHGEPIHRHGAITRVVNRNPFTECRDTIVQFVVHTDAQLPLMVHQFPYLA